MVLHVHGLPDVSLQGLHEVRGPELGPRHPGDGVRLEPGSRSSRRRGSVMIRGPGVPQAWPGTRVNSGVTSRVSGLHLVGGPGGGRGSARVAGAGGGRGVGGGGGGGQTHRRGPEVCVGMGEI